MFAFLQVKYAQKKALLIAERERSKRLTNYFLIFSYLKSSLCQCDGEKYSRKFRITLIWIMPLFIWGLIWWALIVQTFIN